MMIIAVKGAGCRYRVSRFVSLLQTSSVKSKSKIIIVLLAYLLAVKQEVKMS
jgi:hypothetical protein